MFRNLDMNEKGDFLKTFVNLIEIPEHDSVAHTIADSFADFYKQLAKQKKRVEHLFNNRLNKMKKRLEGKGLNNQLNPLLNKLKLNQRDSDVTDNHSLSKVESTLPISVWSAHSPWNWKRWKGKIVTVSVKSVVLCDIFQDNNLWLPRKNYLPTLEEAYNLAGNPNNDSKIWNFSFRNRKQSAYQIAIVDVNEKVLWSKIVRHKAYSYRVFSRCGFNTHTFDKNYFSDLATVRSEIIEICSNRLVLFWGVKQAQSALNLNETLLNCADIQPSFALQSSENRTSKVVCLELKQAVRQFLGHHIHCLSTTDAVVDAIYMMKLFNCFTNEKFAFNQCFSDPSPAHSRVFLENFVLNKDYRINQ